MSTDGKNDLMVCGGQGHGTANISSAGRHRVDSRAVTLTAKGLLQESLSLHFGHNGRSRVWSLEAGVWAKDVAWKSSTDS